MFWCVLKPTAGLADEPSVCEQFCSFRVLIRNVVIGFALCCVSLPANPASSAADLNSPESAEVSLAESLTLPSSLPELGNQSLKALIPTTAGYSIRRTAPEVRLQFSVADERGRLVTNLSVDEIRVLDDHFAVHRIRQFSRAEDLPLEIGVLLDVSDSVQRNVVREKQATQVFLERVMRPLSDRAFLMGFAREAQLWQGSTGDIPALSGALERIRQSGFATNLYDSVFYACLYQFPRAAAGTQVERIILLLSDGEDTSSLHTIGETIALAQRREIQIYAVSIHPGRTLAPGDAILGRLAEETGGEFYVASREKDFPAVFAEMERQMRTQYYVSFPPERQNPGFHDLRIETTSHRNLRIHARQGYYFDAP
jgi:Ca-activated chloride channel family protein